VLCSTNHGESQELSVFEYKMQGLQMPKPTAQAIADMTNAVLSDLNVVKQHLGPHTFNKTEEAWAGIETFVAVGLRVFAQTNPSKLRDVMRTVGIQARMDGKEIFE
jgi:hypothetical protein